jgi:TPR repeat protein
MDYAIKILQRLILAAALSMLAATARAELLDALHAYSEGNYLLAFDEFRTLALNGDADAQFKLGDMYAKGEGVKQDFTEAFSWFLKAAAQDDPRGQLAVADAYEQGRGVPEDHKKAAAWYLTSAEHGNPRAQYAVGLLYAKGVDMPLDLVQARMWLGLANDIAAGSRAWVESKMTAAQIEKAKQLEMEWRERYK